MALTSYSSFVWLSNLYFQPRPLHRISILYLQLSTGCVYLHMPLVPQINMSSMDLRVFLSKLVCLLLVLPVVDIRTFTFSLKPLPNNSTSVIRHFHIWHLLCILTNFCLCLSLTLLLVSHVAFFKTILSTLLLDFFHGMCA